MSSSMEISSGMAEYVAGVLLGVGELAEDEWFMIRPAVAMSDRVEITIGTWTAGAFRHTRIEEVRSIDATPDPRRDGLSLGRLMRKTFAKGRP